MSGVVAFENACLNCAPYLFMNISFARLFMENRKKRGSLDSFLCSKAKQPKLQLNEEPDKVKETGTPVKAEKPAQRRFQQSWKTKHVWLKYDEAKNAMYVLQFLCQDNGKTKSFMAGNSNFRTSTLTVLKACCS